MYCLLINRFRAAVAIIIAGSFIIGLSACVTTTENVFTEEASPEKTLERRVALARQYIGEGNWADAKRNLQLAVDIDPKSPDVYEAFALVYQSTGEYELSEQSFEAAIRLRKPFSRARNNYAAFLFSQGRYRDAEVQLEHVVADVLYSARPNAFINLGLCRLQLSDPEGSQKAFVRALAMDKSNTIALLEIAQLRYNADDINSAAHYYTRYRELVRTQTPRALWLGIRIAQQQGDRNAEGSFVLALRNLHPNSPEYQAYLEAEQSGG